MKEKYVRLDISDKVDDRLAYLSKQREMLEHTLTKLPEGNLLVAPGKSENSFRYYNRKSPQDKMGEYLGKKDEKLKSQLAQRKYVVATIKSMTEEIDKLMKIKSMKLKDSITDTYANMNSGVKKLISPIAFDDETYAKMWLSIPYEGLGFNDDDTTEYYSNKGERMRSKSEVAIANSLQLHEIPYKYECPISRRNGEMIYPDFTILDVVKRRTVYWEHLGRMGDLSYVSKNLWKLEEYKKVGIYLGINLFITFESNSTPMGTNEPMQIVKEILRR